MKVKLETLINNYDALERLASLYLSGKLNFRNSRTLDDARKLRKTYDETNLATIKKYGGRPINDAQWQFPSTDKMKAYDAEMRPLLDEEVEIYGEPYELKLDSFNSSQLNGAQMLALSELGLVIFVEDEDEQEAPQEETPKGETAKAKRAKR